MTAWLVALACTATMASAALLYAASPHCVWHAWRRRRGVLAGGFALAASALTAWIAALGPGAGACAMLVGWMLALAAQPYLALLADRRAAEAAALEDD
jgi:hypothetical protein